MFENLSIPHAMKWESPFYFCYEHDQVQQLFPNQFEEFQHETYNQFLQNIYQPNKSPRVSHITAFPWLKIVG